MYELADVDMPPVGDVLHDSTPAAHAIEQPNELAEDPDDQHLPQPLVERCSHPSQSAVHGDPSGCVPTASTSSPCSTTESELPAHNRDSALHERSHLGELSARNISELHAPVHHPACAVSSTTNEAVNESVGSRKRSYPGSSFVPTNEQC